jgi:hypothetical protein
VFSFRLPVPFFLVEIMVIDQLKAGYTSLVFQHLLCKETKETSLLTGSSTVPPCFVPRSLPDKIRGAPPPLQPPWTRLKLDKPDFISY